MNTALRGMAGRGTAWLGNPARGKDFSSDWRGDAGHSLARQCNATQGKDFSVARQGTAWQGTAWLGKGFSSDRCPSRRAAVCRKAEHG